MTEQVTSGETLNLIESKIHGLRLEMFANHHKEQSAMKTAVLNAVKRGVSDAMAPLDARVERGFATLAGEAHELRGRIARLDDRVAGLDDRIIRLDERITRLDDRVVGLDERVTRLDGRVVGLDERVIQLDQRVARLDDHLTQLDDNVVTLGVDVEQIDHKMKHLVDLVSDGYGVHEARLKDCETTLKQFEEASASGEAAMGAAASGPSA